MRFRQAMVAWGLVAVCAGSMVQAQAARLMEGTAVRVRLTADLVSAQATAGARVDMEVTQPVTLQGVVVIPSGAAVWGAVQDVKKGKSLRFDIEGVRLPSKEIVKLRSISQRKKAGIPLKDEIKVETQVGGDLGAAKGSEFTAYLDQDVDVNVPGAPATPAPPPPVAAPAAAPQPAAPTAPVAAPPMVSAPAAPAPAPMAHPAPTGQPGEYITLECFSEPLGADILIDDEFHGSTPSIIKLLPGNYQIELRLMGYKPHSQPLNLTPGTGLRTVRVTLEKQP